MTIPNLDHDGFLPEGVHECSLVELDEQFGRFQGSDRRSVLFAKFVEYLGEVRSSGLATFVIVDGSFVTAKAEPNDIDSSTTRYRGEWFASVMVSICCRLVRVRKNWTSTSSSFSRYAAIRIVAKVSSR